MQCQKGFNRTTSATDFHSVSLRHTTGYDYQEKVFASTEIGEK